MEHDHVDSQDERTHAKHYTTSYANHSKPTSICNTNTGRMNKFHFDIYRSPIWTSVQVNEASN